MDYAALKIAHLGCVALSYALFVVRGIWMMRESALLQQCWVKIVPHVIDFILLASAVAPATTILILLTLGQSPILGWGSLWQWVVMSLGGALATPIFFITFGWLNHALGYQRIIETSFRPDREIRRRRN